MQIELPVIWEHVRDDLRVSVTDAGFRLLDPLVAVAVDDGCLFLSAPNPIRAFVERRYAPLITELAARRAPEIHCVAFLPPGQDNSCAQPGAAEPPATVPLNPKYTFDQFVIGPGNRFAHSAALHVAESPGQAWNPLFIYGAPGLGKTHLLGSIAHYVRSHGGGLRSHYTTAERFTNEFLTALRRGDTDSFKQRYRHFDILLIDDVQFLEAKRKTEEEFFHTFNELHESGSQIVLSSDRCPEDMSAMEQRLRDRFEWGLTADVGPANLDTRIAILRKLADHEGPAEIGPGVLEAIAAHITTNIRQLEGALIRVVAFASLSGRPLDIELTGEVLRDLYGGRRPAAVTVDQIQGVVCDSFRVDRDQLLAPRRSADLVYPRQLAMFLSRELTDLSLPLIGRAFGGRDPSTVLHAVRKIERLVGQDRAVHDLVGQLTTRIQGGHPDAP